jgi:hypothetical protein
VRGTMDPVQGSRACNGEEGPRPLCRLRSAPASPALGWGWGPAGRRPLVWPPPSRRGRRRHPRACFPRSPCCGAEGGFTAFESFTSYTNRTSHATCHISTSHSAAWAAHAIDLHTSTSGGPRRRPTVDRAGWAGRGRPLLRDVYITPRHALCALPSSTPRRFSYRVLRYSCSLSYNISTGRFF